MPSPVSRMEQQEKKLLIFIVAFNAEKEIQKVLQRIPERVLQKYAYEILIIDDSSADNTFENAHRFHENNQRLNIRILSNPVPQRYGGNQKLGYEYAVRNGFDVVLLLHGGGQYAPEVMDDLLVPLFERNADAVIGSRMLRKGEALSGGMPLYKLIGNQIVTRLQNKLLGTLLTDYHSGYRAYSVAALKEIPFALNSNDFHFDTQLIIQFILARKRIREVPIPAFYEKGIYDLNKIRFTWNILKETLLSRLQKTALFYRREYDLVPFSEEYSLKLGYPSSHSLAIMNVAEHSRVLDIGGGQGRIAAELKKKGCFVAGIDKNLLVNSGNYDLYYQRDLDFMEFDFDMTGFDHVLMLDIIEHLSQPEHFLDTLRRQFGLSQPKIIITVPNIGFFISRLQLLFGNFNYGKEGILDKTHKRLYTFRTIAKNCRQSGYRVEKVRGIPAPFPKALGNNLFSRFLVYLNQLLIYILRGFFAYQIYLEVRPTPVVEHLLDYSLAESLKRKERILEQRNKEIR